MRIGITLPQFRPKADAALAAARAAEDAGLDGVFVFDHVYAIGQPQRPALNAWPLLGALAAETQRVSLGTLVARVSLLPTAVLEHNFASLQRMIGGRLIAGLGAGDKLSRGENEAVGVRFPEVDERLLELVAACRAVRALGIETWVGGLSDRVRAIAGAEADALNLWSVPPAELGTASVPITWGGPVGTTLDEAADLLRRLAAAGATWAVCAPPYGAAEDPEPAVRLVAEAAAAVR
jgi:alkanesulfonate monooxygenase SsuD/methylene tetrahydromethanopterin reductase-like flavin-dependent oxidoreductase (luciferase family)